MRSTYFADMALRNAESALLAREALLRHLRILQITGVLPKEIYTGSSDDLEGDYKHAKEHLERVKEGKARDTWPIPERPTSFATASSEPPAPAPH